MNSDSNPIDRVNAVKAICDALADVSPAACPADESTPLLGIEAIVDSVGFVTLLITLEQTLGGNVDLANSFIAVGNSPDEGNPFRTVGSLADHVQALSAESERK